MAMRLTGVAMLLAVLAVAGCGARLGPAGEASSTNVNPITGSRGGSGAAN